MRAFTTLGDPWASLWIWFVLANRDDRPRSYRSAAVRAPPMKRRHERVEIIATQLRSRLPPSLLHTRATMTPSIRELFNDARPLRLGRVTFETLAAEANVSETPWRQLPPLKRRLLTRDCRSVASTQTFSAVER